MDYMIMVRHNNDGYCVCVWRAGDAINKRHALFIYCLHIGDTSRGRNVQYLVLFKVIVVTKCIVM